MRKLATQLVLMASAVIFVAFLNVGEADAFTCSSLCNQVRRACNSVAKGDKNIAYAVCDEGRDSCRVACETIPETCIAVCDAALAGCMASCAADPTCAAACEAARAECPDECPDCCNTGRVSCRETARVAQQEARLACETSRMTCKDTCVDPIDGACVRGCKSVEHDCRGAAQKSSVACKRSCVNGTGRRACVRDCRKLLNQGLRLCSDQEILCLTGCF